MSVWAYLTLAAVAFVLAGAVLALVVLIWSRREAPNYYWEQ